MTVIVRRPVLVWSVFLVVGVTSKPASAGEYYDVILANRLVCRLRDRAGYPSVYDRGAAVEKCVVEALSVEDVGKPKMWIKTINGRPAIFIGKTFLVQVWPGDAAGTGRSVRSLARQWMAAFQQQFPRAEPVTKIGAAPSAAEQGAASVRTVPTPKKPVEVPEEDKALVSEVESLLASGRSLASEEFEAKRQDLATEAVALIWRASSGGADCAQFDVLEGRANAVQSTLNGFRFVRGLSDQEFSEQRTLIALTIVRRVRTALAASS